MFPPKRLCAEGDIDNRRRLFRARLRSEGKKDSSESGGGTDVIQLHSALPSLDPARLIFQLSWILTFVRLALITLARKEAKKAKKGQEGPSPHLASGVGLDEGGAWRRAAAALSG